MVPTSFFGLSVFPEDADHQAAGSSLLAREDAKAYLYSIENSEKAVMRFAQGLIAVGEIFPGAQQLETSVV